MNTTASGRAFRPSDGIALALLVGTVAVGAFAYDAVPAEMVIHYTPPGGVYYGPETVAKAIGLAIVPVVSAVTFVVLRGLLLLDDLNERLAPVRPYYQACLVAVLALLCGTQVLLVLLNVA